MKNRKRIIVAFLVVAMLVVGVGYAAVNGTLNIIGQASFAGQSLVSNEIYEALQFETVSFVVGETDYSDVCSGSISSNHAADMTVTFKDGSAIAGAVFTAKAVYTVKYDTNVQSLPDVLISKAVPTITSAAGSPGWTIETDMTDDVTLAPGQSFNITVTVQYTNQDPAVTGSVSAAINVPMPFVTVATGTVSSN